MATAEARGARSEVPLARESTDSRAPAGAGGAGRRARGRRRQPRRGRRGAGPRREPRAPPSPPPRPTSPSPSPRPSGRGSTSTARAGWRARGLIAAQEHDAARTAHRAALATLDAARRRLGPGGARRRGRGGRDAPARVLRPAGRAPGRGGRGPGGGRRLPAGAGPGQGGRGRTRGGERRAGAGRAGGRRAPAGEDPHRRPGRRDGREEDGRARPDGPGRPAAPRHRPARGRLGRRELQGDPGRPRPPGQPATIRVDTFPDRVFRGRVDSHQRRHRRPLQPACPPRTPRATGSRWSSGCRSRSCWRTTMRTRISCGPACPRSVTDRRPVAPGPEPARRHDRRRAPGRRWLITVAVMLVASMQVLDTSVTNVALPHMQGSLSASLDEITWVLTSFLAANAVILPATGWLVARLGRRRFFLIATIDVHGELAPLRGGPEPRAPRRRAAAPGAGRGPADPALPGHPHGDLPAAPARDGHGHLGSRRHGVAHRGPDRRRLDHRQLLLALDLLPEPAVRRARAGARQRVPGGRAGERQPDRQRPPARFDGVGLALLVAGIGALQVALDQGQRLDWFDSSAITTLVVVAVVALAAFVLVGASRRLPARRPSGPREPHVRPGHAPDDPRRLRALRELPAPHVLRGAPPALRRAHRRVGAGAGRGRARSSRWRSAAVWSTASIPGGSSPSGWPSSPTRSSSWAR